MLNFALLTCYIYLNVLGTLLIFLLKLMIYVYNHTFFPIRIEKTEGHP